MRKKLRKKIFFPSFFLQFHNIIHFSTTLDLRYIYIFASIIMFIPFMFAKQVYYIDLQINWDKLKKKTISKTSQ